MRQSFIKFFKFCQEVKPIDIRNQPPHIITREITSCTSKDKLGLVLDQHGGSFNLINLSGFINKYSHLKNQTGKDYQQKILKTAEQALKREMPQNAANHRAMLNMFFYASRLGTLGQKLTDMLLQYDLTKLLSNPNSKECMMITVGLCRMKKQKEIKKIIPIITDWILNDKLFETTHIVQIWQNILRNGYSDPKTDQIISRVLKNRDQLSLQDFIYLVTCYSMVDKSMIDQSIIKKLRNYPKVQLVNIKIQQLSMLCSSLRAAPWLQMPYQFKLALTARFKSMIKSSKLKQLWSTLHYLGQQLIKSQTIVKQIENRLSYLQQADQQQPVRFDHWVQIVKKLTDLKYRVNSIKIQRVMIMALVEKNNKWKNVTPQHFCMALETIANIEQKNDNYEPSLAFRSTLSSYIAKNIAQFNTEQLLVLTRCLSKVSKSKQVCQVIHKHINNSQNAEIQAVLYRPCLLNRKVCLNCLKN